MKVNSIRLTSIVILLFFNIQLGCKKNEDPIPNVYISIEINVTNTQFNELNAVGGWVYLTGGVRGIVVYRKSIDEFQAFERNCPYKPSDECARIEVESSGLTAIDSCCNSRFLLLDGSVVNGPSTLSLKEYKTMFDGTKLYISNY